MILGSGYLGCGLLGADGGFDPAAPGAGFTTTLWLKKHTGLFQDTAGTTPATGTDPVGRWSDQISTRHFIQATNKPNRSAGGVTFDGTNDLLSPAAGGPVPPSDYMVCVRVRRLSGVGAVNAGIFDSGGPVPRHWFWAFPTSTSVSFQCFRADVGASATDTNTMTANAWINLVMVRRTADCEVYIDGASNGATAVALGNTANSTTMELGGRTGVSFANMEVAEFFIVNGTATAGKIAEITAYLGTL